MTSGLSRRRLWLVHGARDELLAGSGLAGHQHRGVGASDLLDLIEQSREGGRPADDVLGVGLARNTTSNGCDDSRGTRRVAFTLWPQTIHGSNRPLRAMFSVLP